MSAASPEHRPGRPLARGLLLASLLVGAAGCPLAHDDPSPYVCLKDEDCYIRENEYCTSKTFGQPGECRLRLDASVADASSPRERGLPDRGPDGADAAEAGPTGDGVGSFDSSTPDGK